MTAQEMEWQKEEREWNEKHNPDGETWHQRTKRLTDEWKDCGKKGNAILHLAENSTIMGMVQSIPAPSLEMKVQVTNVEFGAVYFTLRRDGKLSLNSKT